MNKCSKIVVPFAGRNLFRILFLAIFFFLPVKGVSQNLSTTWQEQLAFAKSDSCSDGMGDMCHLRLINYTYKGEIASETEKSEIIDSILSDDAAAVLLLPSVFVSDTIITDNSYMIQMKEFPRFEIISVSKMLEIIRVDSLENPFVQIRKELDDLIKVGFEFVQIEWSYKGSTCYSVCIVSDENGGVIYDSIAFNILYSNSTTYSTQK